MPSGERAAGAGRFTAETQRRRGGRGGGGSPGRGHVPSLCVAAIRRKEPMPGGAADLHRGEERVHAATVGCGGAAQGDHLGRVEAVGAADGGAAGAPRGGARAGAEPAMHPAAPVLHGPAGGNSRQSGYGRRSAVRPGSRRAWRRS